jgi:hypothetical protein
VDRVERSGLPRHPGDQEHSIAWCFWHLARIEDATMSRLVAGEAQLFHLEPWPQRLGVPFVETGNAMTPAEIAALSAGLDMPALRAYRLAVGQRTRHIVAQIRPADLKKKIDPSRLEQVLADGAVVEATRSMLEYWGSLSLAGCCSCTHPPPDHSPQRGAAPQTLCKNLWTAQ